MKSAPLPAPSDRATVCSPTEAVVVRAPSRLHFGLLSWGNPGRQFGGVGAMVRDPELIIRGCASPEFTVSGPVEDRVREFVSRWICYHGFAQPPAVHLEVAAIARPHTGLGTGTQLGLAVAATLQRLAGKPLESAATLARAVGRGRRSAIGTYGFWRGGMIVERGKLPDEALSPLAARVSLPDQWRFVLVCPKDEVGLYGGAENRAFETLPAVDPNIATRLGELVDQRLLPAARAAEFATFGRTLYEFGRLAGSCFARQQGGPYNGPRLTALVEQMRAMGVEGVGQSSWGPTLFALLPTAGAAASFVQDLRRGPAADQLDLRITAPDNDGARLNDAPIGDG